MGVDPIQKCTYVLLCFFDKKIRLHQILRGAFKNSAVGTLIKKILGITTALANGKIIKKHGKGK
ncbi:MAG: hypothetical protein CMK56_06200 [Proteobacteria bacterium]|nr:hypothetical protein [Pseudomonadota bacterium]